MQYQTFSPTPNAVFSTAILVPKLDQRSMEQEYLTPGFLDVNDTIAYALHQTGKKTKVDVQREFLDDLMPTLEDIGVKYILVSDSDYFKTITGVNQSEAFLGYVLPNKYPANMAGQFNVLFVPNYRQVFYNPGPTRVKIQQAMDSMLMHRKGGYREPGCEIIRFSAYPTSLTDIVTWLGRLLEMDCDLTCDIEGFSLKHYSCGVGTISFAWSQHEGISFPVDLGSHAPEVRRALIDFFRAFKRKMIYHRIAFDATVLIYQLFMKDISDTEGMLDGMEVMLRDFDCSLLIAYFATNSCAGNKLGLKVQAQEFAGNYAVDEIKDITKIPMPELLQYNLIDTLSTWYVRDKHWPAVVADQQQQIYEELFKPAIWDIIQMQLTGMPLDMEKVEYARDVLETDRVDAIRRIQAHNLVRSFTHHLNEQWVIEKNETLKKKRVTLADAKEEFNPNSTPQLQSLLYEMIGLPVMARTKTKQPSTKADEILKLKAYTTDQGVKDLLDALLDYAKVDKLYGTFIPAMLGAVQAADGRHYLFGNFNLAGTVSGRLSSSDPNIQTIPAKDGKYTKIIKDCFRAPKGYLMIGLDFSSLEDRISALTTKDPNKLKVYTDGYDGHCLRAYGYWPDEMPDIDPNSVDSINAIAKKYPVLRQKSKTPTFLLTYDGTWIGMMAKCNFTEEVAKGVEANYHCLYKVSDDWVSARLDEASQVGYVTVAFGLRVRTPLLHQVIRGTSATPYEASAEGRTAGNALGQSWCLLNTRASVEFMQKVRASKYRLKIRPIAHIHDAQYYLIPDDLEVLHFVNEHLVKAVEWQDDPAIAHDVVKLGGELSVFYPSWATDIGIKNAATDEDVYAAVEKSLKKKAA